MNTQGSDSIHRDEKEMNTTLKYLKSWAESVFVCVINTKGKTQLSTVPRASVFGFMESRKHQALSADPKSLSIDDELHIKHFPKTKKKTDCHRIHHTKCVSGYRHDARTNNGRRCDHMLTADPITMNIAVVAHNTFRVGVYITEYANKMKYSMRRYIHVIHSHAIVHV